MNLRQSSPTEREEESWRSQPILDYWMSYLFLFVVFFVDQRLHIVVMIPPVSFLWVLWTGSDVDGIVRRQFLFFGWRQHWCDWQADSLDWQRRTPVFCEDRQADVSVWVDVGVDRHFVADKRHFRRLEGVLRTELELKAELLAVVKGLPGASHLYTPYW